MAVKLLTSLAGFDGDKPFAYAPGEVVSRPAKEEKALIEKGMAEPVKEARPKKSGK